MTSAKTGGEVKPAWMKEAAQREQQDNAKKFGALKAALLGGLPAISGGIEYRRVSAIIYRKHPMGGYRLSVELEDRGGGSVTVASPRQVEVLGAETGESGPLAEELAEEAAVLKKALLSGIPTVCDWVEYRQVCAILFRRSESGDCWIQAELEKCGGLGVVVVSPRSVQIQNPGTCDELCEIETEAPV